jgi:hypothetical protein
MIRGNVTQVPGETADPDAMMDKVVEDDIEKGTLQSPQAAVSIDL